ncbi:hypothetical protein PUN28_010518 [Cardiocondyla obscurior]|uniref:Uncharacterized protein n=1 Tax=Cardiocondyla obscurior TaxID=286306 RepID=A0AAW2FM56_9HYME
MSEVICDANTCGGCRYLEQDDWPASLAEFLANCQHTKCKVVRLVRQQISKLQNMQYEAVLATRGEMREKTHNETSNKMQDMLEKLHNGAFDEIQDMFKNDVHEVYEPDDDLREAKVEQAFNESHGKLDEAQKTVATTRQTVRVANTIEDAATASLRRAASPGRAVDRKWMLRILDRVRHRAHLILAAAAVGVIVWTALVYGVFLGATACGSGRTCSRLPPKYTQAKRTLF